MNDLTKPSPQAAQARMLELIREAGLEGPDEILHLPEREEIHFRWHERKLCVVLELGSRVGVRDVSTNDL